jgi:pimeloyl-ACP methyl ester carboxylesterase
MSTNSPNPSAPTLSPPPVGDFVVADGRRFFLHRAGKGGPTIVFLPGAGLVGLDYFNVFGGASELSSVVLYDRGGTGWSDAVTLPRSPDEVTDELRSVLQAAGVESPYLLVGHSLGGGYAQHFARRFPSEVAALLLLDPAHEDYETYGPPKPETDAAQAVDLSAWEPPPEVIEGYRALFTQKFAEWPPNVRQAMIDYHVTCWRTGMDEASNLDAILAALRRPAPLPDIPLIILTALDLDPGSSLFMSEEWQRQVIEGKTRLNRVIAASVPRGEDRQLPDASHSWIQADRPDAVLQALRDLLAIVR